MDNIILAAFLIIFIGLAIWITWSDALGIYSIASSIIFAIVVIQNQNNFNKIEVEIDQSVTFSYSDCSYEYPLLIKIENKEPKRISDIDFDVGFYDKEGNVIYYTSYYSYSIKESLAPNEKFTSCYRILNKGQLADSSDIINYIYNKPDSYWVVTRMRASRIN